MIVEIYIWESIGYDDRRLSNYSYEKSSGIETEDGKDVAL